MKTLILLSILGLLQSSDSIARDLNSVSFGGCLNAAKERAKRENKLLILEFSAKWCLPCRYMEKNVFQNENVQRISSQHAIIFQIDIDENKNLKEEFKIEVLPTIILMNASGEIISKREESLDAQAFLNWIETNKNLIPDSELATTTELETDEPVVVEQPILDTNEFEQGLNQKLADSNPKLNDKSNNKLKNYHLQAGVFSSKENAENMVALLSINFQEEIKIVEETKDNNNIFKVCVGSFNNKEEAVIFQQVLDKYKFKAVIRQN